MYSTQRMFDILSCQVGRRPKTIYQYYETDDAARAAAKAVRANGDQYVLHLKPAAYTKDGRARLSLSLRREKP